MAQALRAKLLLASISLFFTIPCRSRGQPILPSLSYPVFVYNPGSSARHEEDTSSSAGPEEGFEVSQFHSQDELGRVVFGFHGPDQSRMEARSLDGSVRGSYSYIDPYGHIVKMQYWDDGTGFHVAGNALPGSTQDTPEVAAAREQHLKIYKQTLAAAQQLMTQSDESAYADSPDSDHSLGSSQFEDLSLDKEHHGNGLYVDDKESVSLENPEMFNNHDSFQDDERKEHDKPQKEQVEGEVDLGEDIGPEEDIEGDYENDQPYADHRRFNEQKEEDDRIIDYDDYQDKVIFRLKHSINNYANQEKKLRKGKNKNDKYDSNDEGDHDDDYRFYEKFALDYQEKQKSAVGDKKPSLKNDDSIVKENYRPEANENMSSERQESGSPERKESSSSERRENSPERDSSERRESTSLKRKDMSSSERSENTSPERESSERHENNSPERESSERRENTSPEREENIAERLKNTNTERKEKSSPEQLETESQYGRNDNEGSLERNKESIEHIEEEEDDHYYDTETSENRNAKVMVVYPITEPEATDRNINGNLDKPTDQVAEKSTTETKVVPPTVKRRAFFYHFQHTIPKPTERIETAVERGLESADAVKVPPSAIHDPQLPYHFLLQSGLPLSRL